MANNNTITLNKKQQEQLELKQEKDFTDETIYNINEVNSSLAAGGCGVCARKGFPIFLVRKTVIAKNFDNQRWSKNVKSLGDREPVVDLESHEWAYRTLRKGFVYILVKRTKPIQGQSKNYQYLFYEVTPSGVLRHTTVNQPIEKNVPEIPKSCITDGHQYKGLFATIDTSIYGGEVYIGYSRRAWSRKTLDTYREAANAGNAEKLARFSKINISDESKKDPTQLSIDSQPRSFPFKDFETGTKLLEFNIDEHFTFDYNETSKLSLISKQKTVEVPSLVEFIKSLNKNMGDICLLSEQKYFTAHQFNSLVYNKVKAEIGGDNDLKKMSVLIVEDPMAVAEELAFFRKMKLQPISQALIESESVSQLEASNTYKVLLGKGNDEDAELDYEKQFDNIVKQQSKAPRNYQHWAQNIDGLTFDYFDEKSLHLKKIMQYIDSFEITTKNHIKESSPDFTIYKYDYLPGSTVYGWIIGKHAMYKDQNGDDIDPYSQKGINFKQLKPRSLTEDEILMQKKEQDRIDTEEDGNYTVKLSAYLIKKAEVVYNERVENEWTKKYESQLKLDKKTEALETMKADYEQLVDFIKKHSIDYYTYLTWLWGGKQRAQMVIDKAKELQKKQEENTSSPIDILPAMSKYNEVEFWIEEWDTNGSNSHIGSLCDFVNILDDCQLGNIKTPYQFAVWDLLLINNTSIYYHIIHGINGDLVTGKAGQLEENSANGKNSSKSWWDLLLEVKLEISKLSPVEYKQLKQQYLTQEKTSNSISLESELQTAEDKDITENRTVALIKLINDYKHELNDLFFVEKGLILLQLFDVLIMRMTSAVGQRDKTKDFIDYNVWNPHLAQAGMVLSGQPVVKLKIDNIPAKDVAGVLDQFYGIDDSRIKSLSSDESDSILTTIFITTTMPTIYDLYDKVSPLLAGTSGATSFSDFHTTVSTNLRSEMTGEGVFACDFSKAKLNISSVRFDGWGKYSLEGGGFAIKAITLIGVYQSMEQTRSQLESFGLGEKKIKELSNQLMLATVNYHTSYTLVVCGAIELSFKGGLGLYNATFMRIASCSLVKGAFGIIKIAGSAAGVIGGAVGVIEGISSFRAAWAKYEKGGQYAMLYVVGTGFQILSGALSILASLGLLACLGPVGAILFLVALAGVVVTSLLQIFYKDESDDWDPMQNWLNRCEFGMQNHPDKGDPYPVTYEGMAFLTNDYFVARMGLSANFMFREEDLLWYEVPVYKIVGDEGMTREGSFYDSNLKRGPFDAMKKGQYDPEVMAEKQQRHLTCTAVYLTMKLAKQLADQPENDFEGTLRIDYGVTMSKEVIKFEKNQNSNVGISLSNYKPLTYFGLRPAKILLNNKNHEGKLSQSEVGLEEFIGNRDEDNIGVYFGVNFKLGESAGTNFKAYLRCKYWINGRVNKTTGKENIPILLYYKY